MSFAFQVHGHAGHNMKANSPEEAEAVREIIKSLLSDALKHRLNLTVHSVEPPDWAHEQHTTYAISD